MQRRRKEEDGRKLRNLTTPNRTGGAKTALEDTKNDAYTKT